MYVFDAELARLAGLSITHNHWMFPDRCTPMLPQILRVTLPAHVGDSETPDNNTNYADISSEWWCSKEVPAMHTMRYTVGHLTVYHNPIRGMLLLAPIVARM